MHFGEKLRQLRKQKDWTQPQLAEAIGIEQSYLSKLENGKSIPSADIYDLILTVFNIDTATILSDIDQSVIHRQLRQIPEVANYLSERCVANNRQSKLWLLGSSLFVSIGIVALVASHFGLLFPETHYNYYSQGVVLSGESKEVFKNYRQQHYGTRKAQQEAYLKMSARLDENYLLLSAYRGHIFNIPVEGGSRTYELHQTVSRARTENRILAVIGLLVLLLGVFGFILERKLARSK